MTFFLGYLFILHFVSDFLLQSRKMGEKKSSSFGWLTAHVVITMLVFFFGLYAIMPMHLALIIAIFNGILHGIVDGLTWNGYKLFTFSRKYAQWYDKDLGVKANMKVTKERLDAFEYWKDHWFYVTIGFDQLLHVLSILFVLMALGMLR